VLVKGVILQADLIISVAEVPLIGVNLRAAIAGMKTMLDYGMMEAWDENIRSIALEGSGEDDIKYEEGEAIIHRTYASFNLEDDPYAWWNAHLILTNHRLLLMRRKPLKKKLELNLDKILEVRFKKSKFIENSRKTLAVRYGFPKKTGVINIFSSDLNILASKMGMLDEHLTALIPLSCS
jgi:hypothetical protein